MITLSNLDKRNLQENRGKITGTVLLLWLLQSISTKRNKLNINIPRKTIVFKDEFPMTSFKDLVRIQIKQIMAHIRLHLTLK